MATTESSQSGNNRCAERLRKPETEKLQNGVERLGEMRCGQCFYAFVIERAWEKVKEEKKLTKEARVHDCDFTSITV